MAKISGLFAIDQLLPSYLMSGLRLEFHLAEGRVALVNPAAVDPPTYHIKNATVVLSSSKLTDSIQRSMNSQASKGLQIVYKTWHASETVFGASTTLNQEQRLAVSRALGAFAKVRPQYSVDEEYKQDSFASEPWNIVSYQFRCGALYFPSQPIASVENSTTQTAVESYVHAVDAMARKAGVSRPRVSTENFETSKGIMAVDVERSAMVNLSGIALNSSRVLALNARFKDSKMPTATVTDRRSTIFLNYIKAVTVFLNNTEVQM
jgi:hypothetical protein